MSGQLSPPTAVSSATKIWWAAVSMTGVPVMPRGLMSPQPPDSVGAESITDVVTACPIDTLHSTFPVVAAMASSVSFSVPT